LRPFFFFVLGFEGRRCGWVESQLD
jgi:hypothetical protein